jgi:hypothetical protein
VELVRVLLTRLFRILRAEWGYWRHGRRERRRVVVARPSSTAYKGSKERFDSLLPTGNVWSVYEGCFSCAPMTPPVLNVKATQLLEKQSQRRIEAEVEVRLRTDPRLSRDRFNPGRNTA